PPNRGRPPSNRGPPPCACARGFGISPGPGRSRPCPRDQEARPRSGAGFLGGFLGLRGPAFGSASALALPVPLTSLPPPPSAPRLRHRLGAVLVPLGHLVGGPACGAGPGSG